MKTLTSIVLFCWAACAQIVSAEETIYITTGEFAPWTSESLIHKGFTNHVVSEAFKLEGYNVEFTFYPWKRATEAAKKGEKFQASSYWYYSVDRAKDFYYSDPLQTDAVVFFHLNSNPLLEWDTLEDLKGKRIGASAGFTYTDEFRDAAESKRLDIRQADSEVTNFKKLLAGGIDLFPSDPLVGQKILEQTFGKEQAAMVSYHPKPLVAPTGHLIFSKQLANGKELAAVFNRGLAKLRESGRYHQFQADLIAGKYDP